MDLLKLVLTGIGAAATLNKIVGISPALSVYQAFLTLTQSLAKSDSGDPVAELHTKVERLEEDSSQSFPVIVESADLLFRNILADDGKMQAVGEHRLAADPGWTWDQGKLLEAARLTAGDTISNSCCQAALPSMSSDVTATRMYRTFSVELTGPIQVSPISAQHHSRRSSFRVIPGQSQHKGCLYH